MQSFLADGSKICYVSNPSCAVVEPCCCYVLLWKAFWDFYPGIARFRSSHPGGVLRKRSSENMQQIYRRTPMPKCDFNKVALRHGHSPVNLLHIFRTPFLKNTSGRLLLQVGIVISVAILFLFLVFMKVCN